MKLALALSLSALFFASSAFAQDGLGFHNGDSQNEILLKQEGKNVQFILKSGEKIAGKLEKVGTNYVHLTGLVGQEFYEAAVSTDDISVIIVRAKKD